MIQYNRLDMSPALRIPLLVLLLLLEGCAAPETIPPLPQTFERPMVWSDLRLTGGEDPHAYGLQVELWKHDGEFAGFVVEYVGPPADAPAGKLDAIAFDEKTGGLSFVSKLSVGVVLSEEGNAWVPAKNEYAFSGTVDENRMTGSLERRTIQPNGSVTTAGERITLERDRSREDSQTARSYPEWLDLWSGILQLRGPRW